MANLTTKSESELAKLWQDFQDNDDALAREKLIIHYAYLVKYVVHRLMVTLPATIDNDDLMGYGIMGLIQSVEKFNLARGIKFETFSMPRIRGAIIDELRAQDWLPRSLRQKAKNIEKTISKLEGELGRAPNEDEIAASLNIGTNELQQILSETSFLVLSLDYLLSPEAGDKSISIADTIADDDRKTPYMIYESKDMRTGLQNAITNLPEREKLLITLYYYEGLTMKEIGKVMTITEARVCQLHTQAILRMKSRLVNYA